MNRIYQRKVTAVEIPFPSLEGSGVGHSNNEQGKPLNHFHIGNRSSLIGDSPKALDAVNSEIKELL